MSLQTFYRKMISSTKLLFPRWLKLWYFQIISMVVSIALVVVLMAVLMDSDGKRVTPDRETLNAKVSALSTSNGVFLLLVIGSCLSQQNWILFSEERRSLYDFQAISDASRGLQGSLLLLLRSFIGWCFHCFRRSPHRFRGGTIVKVGAIATCLAVAMDPFAQKIITFEETWDKRSSGASIPFSSRYSRGIRLAGLSGVDANDGGRVALTGPDVYANADFDMQAAVSIGLSAGADAIQQQTPFSCAGAQCEFEPFESLSVCSMCSNITGHIEKNTKSDGGLYNNLQYDQSLAQVQRNCTEFTLPNGLLLNNIDDVYGPSNRMVYMTMKGTSSPNATVVMSHLDTLIWAQTILKATRKPDLTSKDKWPNVGITASECALYYCVRRYENIKYNNSRMTFTSERQKDTERDPGSWSTLGSLSDRLSNEVFKTLAYHPQDSIIRRSDLRLRTVDSTSAWNVSDTAIFGISYHMQTVFAACLRRGDRANCTTALEDWVLPNGFYVSSFSGDDRVLEDYNPSTAKVLWETDNLESLFQNVAASMSNALRRGADGESRGDGTVLTPIIIYHVVWPWITLHCLEVLTASLILASTIISTQKRSNTIDAWKSSELAVFARGAALKGILEGLHTKDELERKAKDVKVDLFETSKEARANDSEELLHGRRGHWENNR